MRLRCLSVRVGFAASIALVATAAGASARQFIISVPGIPGPYCAYGIEKRLLELPGVKRVALVWKEAQVTATIADDSSLTAAQIEEAVRRADYPYNYKVSIGE